MPTELRPAEELEPGGSERVVTEENLDRTGAGDGRAVRSGRGDEGGTVIRGTCRHGPLSLFESIHRVGRSRCRYLMLLCEAFLCGELREELQCLGHSFNRLL